MKHDTDTLDRLYAAIQITRPLLRHIAAAVEAGAAPYGLSVGQRAVLEALAALPGATGSDLAQHLELTRQFTSRELQELVAAGLVEPRPNPRHKRAHAHHVTERGAMVLSALRAAEMARLDHFATDFTAAELAAHHKVQLALNGFFRDMAKGGTS